MKKLKIVLVLIITLLTISSTAQDKILGKYHKINSKIIGEEREYYVSLPISYENTTKEYPVIYMLDGDWNFSEGIIGGIRYFEMLSEIPELIIVGIKNTNRSRDVFPYEFTRRDGSKRGGGADNYLTFISDELMPVINKKYRTSDYKIFYGTSSSALTGVYDLLGFKKSYDAYICSSPPIHWSFIDKVDSLITNWKEEERYINLVVGENDYVGLPRANAQLKEKLQRKRITKIDLKYTILEGKRHTPRTSLIVGLKDLFKEYKFSSQLNDENLEGYLEHVKKMSKKYNTEFIPVEGALNRYANRLLNNEKTKEESLKLFLYIIEKFPNSSNAFDSLGEAYLVLEDHKKALVNCEKALELNPNNRRAKERIKEIKSKLSEGNHND